MSCKYVDIYHGTNKKGIKELKKSYGRFGYGLYFTRDIEEAKRFGKHIIKKSINERYIYKLNYIELLNFYPYLSIQEEEGLTNLQEFLKNQDVVEIIYEDGSSEIICYTDIKNIKYI